MGDKFRKKPVVIHAYKYQGGDLWDIFKDIPSWLKDGLEWGKISSNEKGIIIKNEDNYLSVPAGDFIIQGTQREYYNCSPDIFWEIYEEVL